MPGKEKSQSNIARWLIPFAMAALAAGGLLVRSQSNASASSANCVSITELRTTHALDVSEIKIGQARIEERQKAQHAILLEIKTAVKQ